MGRCGVIGYDGIYGRVVYRLGCLMGRCGVIYRV